MSERNNFLARYGHEEHIKPLMDNFKTLKYETRDNLVNNPTLSSDQIHTVLKSASHENRRTVMKNPSIDASHIAKALKDPSEDIRTEALKSPLLNASHIDIALDDSSLNNRLTALRHPAASKENLEKASHDYNYNVSSSAKSRLQNLEIKGKPTGGFDPEKDPMLAKIFNHE